MGATWEQSRSGALAALGKGGKIPDPKVNLTKFHSDFDAAKKAFGTSIDALQKKVLDLQNAISSARNVVRQYQDQIDGDDFGVDEKADKDKIAKAAKILDDFLDGQIGQMDAEIKALDELNKTMIAASKYGR